MWRTVLRVLTKNYLRDWLMGLSEPRISRQETKFFDSLMEMGDAASIHAACGYILFYPDRNKFIPEFLERLCGVAGEKIQPHEWEGVVAKCVSLFVEKHKFRVEEVPPMLQDRLRDTASGTLHKILKAAARDSGTPLEDSVEHDLTSARLTAISVLLELKLYEDEESVKQDVLQLAESSSLETFLQRNVAELLLKISSWKSEDKPRLVLLRLSSPGLIQAAVSKILVKHFGVIDQGPSQQGDDHDDGTLGLLAA